MKSKKKIGTHIVLIIGSLIMIVPFVWMVLTSGKTLTESLKIPITFFPDKFQWKNYTEVMSKLPFLRFYANTLFMIIGRVIFAVVFSSMAAYASARLRFKGSNLFFWIVLIQQMIPGQIFTTPQYLLAMKLHLLDTLPGLLLPGVVSAYGTFLLRQHFKSIPEELGEAAKMDGCNIPQTFFYIMLPLARSGIITISVSTALGAYKDLMWPLIVNVSTDKLTLSAGLASLQGMYSSNYPELMAGAVLASWPMILIYIFFQNKFISGLARSGSKL